MAKPRFLPINHQRSTINSRAARTSRHATLLRNGLIAQLPFQRLPDDAHDVGQIFQLLEPHIHITVAPSPDLGDVRCQFALSLNDAYKNVRFRCPKLDCPPTFFIITAHNPDGITQDDARNEQADGAFQAELRRLGHEFFPVTGGNPDLSHAYVGRRSG